MVKSCPNNQEQGTSQRDPQQRKKCYQSEIKEWASKLYDYAICIVGPSSLETIEPLVKCYVGSVPVVEQMWDKIHKNSKTGQKSNLINNEIEKRESAVENHYCKNCKWNER